MPTRFAPRIVRLRSSLSSAPAARCRTHESANEEAAGYNVQLGLGYLQKGDLAIAKQKLERAQSEGPHNPQVHSAMGLLYERLGDQAGGRGIPHGLALWTQ